MTEECREIKEHLSAFIDDQAENGDVIRRHLQSCEACARHHMQLKKISARMKALPDPDHDPAFTARVMSRVAARVAEEGPRPVAVFPASRRRIPSRTLLAAAAILLFIAGTAWLLYPGGVNAPTMPHHPVSQPRLTSDEAVVEEMERLLEEGTDLTAFELAAWENPLPEYFIVAEEDESDTAIGFDDIVELLLSEDTGEGEGEGETIPGDEDLFGMIEELNQEEEALLQDMLRTWLEEGTV